MVNERGPLCFVDVDWAGTVAGRDLPETDKVDAEQMSVDVCMADVMGAHGFPVVRAKGMRDDVERWLVDLYSGGDAVGRELFPVIQYLN